MAFQNGKYRAKARTWALGESSNKTPEIAVEFEITAKGDYEGRSITWHGYLTEKAFKRTIESLRNCGWTGDDLSAIDSMPNEVDLVVENEEYEGETHAKVKWVNKPGGLALKTPMSPESAKAFAAKLKSEIRAFDAANGKKATNGGRPAAPPPESAPVTEDDIPF